MLHLDSGCSLQTRHTQIFCAVTLQIFLSATNIRVGDASNIYIRSHVLCGAGCRLTPGIFFQYFEWVTANIFIRTQIFSALFVSAIFCDYQYYMGRSRDEPVQPGGPVPAAAAVPQVAALLLSLPRLARLPARGQQPPPPVPRPAPRPPPARGPRPQCARSGAGRQGEAGRGGGARGRGRPVRGRGGAVQRQPVTLRVVAH